MCLPRLREVWPLAPAPQDGDRQVVDSDGAPGSCAMVSRASTRGDWRSGSALRSHRRGHWFEPSIAHRFAAPARRRSGSAALPLTPKRSLVRTQYRPPFERRPGGAVVARLCRCTEEVTGSNPVSPTEITCLTHVGPAETCHSRVSAFHQVRRGQQLACTAMEPSPPGWYRDPKAPGRPALLGRPLLGRRGRRRWTAIPSRDPVPSGLRHRLPAARRARGPACARGQPTRSTPSRCRTEAPRA